MQRRQITLADGRYLIFYTFDDEAPPTSDETGDAPAHSDAPAPQPQAEEERHV